MMLSIPTSVIQYAGRTLWSAAVEGVSPAQILMDDFWSLSAPTLCGIAVLVAALAVLLAMWVVSMGKRLVKGSLFFGGVACYAYGSVGLGYLPTPPWYGALAAMYAWHRACDAALEAATGSVWNASVRLVHKAKSFVLTLLLAVAGNVREGVRKVRSTVVDLLRRARQVPSIALPVLSEVSQVVAAVLFKAGESFDSVMEVVVTVVPIFDVLEAVRVASYKAAVALAALICKAAAATGVKVVHVAAAAPRVALECIVALPRYVLWTVPCFVARSVLKAVLAPILLPLAVVKYCLCTFLASLWLVFIVVPWSVVSAVVSFVR